MRGVVRLLRAPRDALVAEDAFDLKGGAGGCGEEIYLLEPVEEA